MPLLSKNMDKKIIVGILVGVVVLIALAVASLSGSREPSNASANSKNGQPTSQGDFSKFQVAEKIEVVHFHATQQCWSCITVGEYALKTIKEKFPDEYKKGIIVFRDINGELPENRELVMKYRAGGSSLYINAISSGLDNIEEDTAVWRLVTNEQQFLNYFESKLKRLLGK
jgi:hypothetical protein